MEIEGMDKNTLLKKLQNYYFAAFDMQMFLDTHPDDARAFRLFKELVKDARGLMYEYEEKYGPLTAFGASNDNSYTWLKSPWPWEKEGN